MRTSDGVLLVKKKESVREWNKNSVNLLLSGSTPLKFCPDTDAIKAINQLQAGEFPSNQIMQFYSVVTSCIRQHLFNAVCSSVS